jgi:hypothetical protein
LRGLKFDGAHVFEKGNCRIIPNGPAWTLLASLALQVSTIDKLMCEMEVTKPSEMFVGSKYTVSLLTGLWYGKG